MDVYMEIIIGISVVLNVVFLILYIVSRRRCKKLKREKQDILLKIQSLPLTIRSKMDNLCAKTIGLKSKVDALYMEINSISDYLGEKAHGDDDSLERILTPISEEIAMIKNYVNTSCDQNIDNVKINVNIKHDDFELPDKITVSMIENAFKHGDRSAPDFMKIDIIEKEKGNYEILVRNKIKFDAVSRIGDLGGLGIENMKDRISNYNEYNYEYKCSMYTASKDGYFYFKLLFEKR